MAECAYIGVMNSRLKNRPREDVAMMFMKVIAMGKTPVGLVRAKSVPRRAHRARHSSTDPTAKITSRVLFCSRVRIREATTAPAAEIKVMMRNTAAKLATERAASSQVLVKELRSVPLGHARTQAPWWR